MSMQQLQRRALTGVGRTTLMSEIPSNRSIFIACHLYDSLLSTKDIQKRLNDKLLLFDRFKSRVTRDLQYFEIIDDFDCNTCIIEETITSSDLSKYDNVHSFLETALSSFTNQPFKMQLTKPLWRMHLYHFKSLNKTASLIRCHHCICDGVSFGEIWLTLSDDTQSQSYTSLSSTADTSSSDSSNLHAKCNTFWYKLFYGVLWFIGMFIVFYRMIMFSCSNEPKTIFKNKLSERKEISYISDKISFSKLNKVRKAIKINRKKPTFNDFMLAVIAESICIYLQKKNEYIPYYVHIGIPVNVRDTKKPLNKSLIGNKIGSYIVKLPLSPKMNFMDKLKYIKSELDFVKKTPEAIMSFYGIKLLSLLPKFMADFIAPKMTGGMSLVVTNVRGPSNTYFCKAKVINAVGIVPPPMGVGLGYAVFTFDGKVCVACNVDRNCYDDNTAKELLECLQIVLKDQGCI